MLKQGVNQLPITLERLIGHHARYRGDHLAVIFSDQRLSWSAFNGRVNQLANAWTSSEAVDQSRQRAERRAFEQMLDNFVLAWPEVVSEYAN